MHVAEREGPGAETAKGTLRYFILTGPDGVVGRTVVITAAVVTSIKPPSCRDSLSCRSEHLPECASLNGRRQVVRNELSPGQVGLATAPQNLRNKSDNTETV